MADELVPVPAPTLRRVQKPARIHPEDVDAMLAVIPAHAVEKLLPNIPEERREEIKEEIAYYCLGLDGKRRHDVWFMLASQLNEANPGLALQAPEVRRFCLRHVVPNIAVTRSHVARSIIERGLSIDALGAILDARADAQENLEELRGKLYRHETDSKGGLVRTGPTADELAQLYNVVIKSSEKAAKMMEAFGIYPESKAPNAPIVNVNVGLQSAMSKLAGRPISEVVDAKFTEPGKGPVDATPS